MEFTEDFYAVSLSVTNGRANCITNSWQSLLEFFCALGLFPSVNRIVFESTQKCLPFVLQRADTPSSRNASSTEIHRA